MNNPVFHLSGVVRTRAGPEDFNGPLALILQMLSRNKIEIRDIKISLILEQYLAYLDEMAAMDLDVASEFVAMASQLTYIKTRMLLGEDKPEELEELITSLERLRATDVYAGIKAVTDSFGEMYLAGAGLIAKPPEYLAPDREYKYSHDKGDLAEAMLAILLRTASGERAERRIRESYMRPEPYPVADKIAEIAERIRTLGTLAARDIFKECADRSEIVAAFLAVLELCRSGRVLLSEDGGELTVSYNHESTEKGGREYGDT
ncbi:MAG: segregation/condensation protein A [Oscillospiraceae bacterium]|jgi:segregation and condensation protein A|nr:segregation/condensation protein A [Oscillospiraceae bacterium]